jgi:hypothetical protein
MPPSEVSNEVVGRESQKDQRGRPRGGGRDKEKFHRPVLGSAHEI